MNRKLQLLLCLLLCIGLPAMAQKLKIKEGNTEFLKTIAKMNVRYDYSDMGVGKFANEADYIARKKEDYNKKEAGKGDAWEKEWLADRQERFQPQFEELFNKYGPFNIGDFPDETYTMIVKTTATEPGYNIHISRKNAEIDGEIWIVGTKNPDAPMLKISFNRAPGRSFGGYDYDTGFRIQEAYAALGKAVGKFLKK